MRKRAGVDALSLRARAKVNLFLHVTGRRSDGYHELDSLMVFPDLGDSLEIRRAEELTLEVVGPFAVGLGEDIEDNLVFRAAQRLRAIVPGAGGASIRLVKNLPVAAGLGGGSADAAATLKGLLRLWDVKADEVDLALLAAELGADVPACLADRAVLARGIGEVLTPANGLPPFALLLVNPGTSLPTSEVFAARQGAFSDPVSWPGGPTDLDDFVARLAAARNDLQAPAIGIAPEIARSLAAIEAMPGCRLARMSGSGATCFGLFASEPEARDAGRRIGDGQPGWWTAAAAVKEAEA